MASAALAKTPRNEMILDLCGANDAATIAATVYRSLGLYLTPNAVNCVIDRAKRAKDPRALARKSRRGARSSSPWNRPRKKAAAEPPKRLLSDLPEVETLPATARLFINTMQSNCKFPLRGSGIGLIVCGADVAEKSSYCPTCRERTILRDEGGRTPAASAVPNDQTLRSNDQPAVPRGKPRVEEPVSISAAPPTKPAKRARPPRLRKPRIFVGIDGVDLSGLDHLPIRLPNRPRVRVLPPRFRTFFDHGQLDLFGEAGRAH